MAKKLEGKIALVTGGSDGIGFATAKLFVEEGAYVFITGRRQKELDQAVKKIGKNVTGIQGDVSKLADLDRLYAEIKKQKGHIDVLFANAGVYEFFHIDHVTESHYHKMFDINVKGLVFTVQKALPLMKNGGSILLNASIAASKGITGTSIYSGAKAAVRSFARTWSVDLKNRKIRVNVISPGVIETEGTSVMKLDEEQERQFVERVLNGIPMERKGVPIEIANAALFLASDDSRYVTGIELFVDGGLAQV